MFISLKLQIRFENHFYSESKKCCADQNRLECMSCITGKDEIYYCHKKPRTQGCEGMLLF